MTSDPCETATLVAEAISEFIGEGCPLLGDEGSTTDRSDSLARACRRFVEAFRGIDVSRIQGPPGMDLGQARELAAALRDDLDEAPSRFEPEQLRARFRAILGALAISEQDLLAAFAGADAAQQTDEG